MGSEWARATRKVERSGAKRSAARQKRVQSALVKSSGRLELRQLIYISEYCPLFALYHVARAAKYTNYVEKAINELGTASRSVAVKVCAPVRTLDAIATGGGINKRRKTGCFRLFRFDKNKNKKKGTITVQSKKNKCIVEVLQFVEYDADVVLTNPASAT